ncbi:MAG: hypothetical protein ACE5GD_05830 [Candidatus Geothermarchaeales archaeon]
MVSRESLTDDVKEFVLEEADLVGFAPTNRFEGAPQGHGPRDFLPKAKSVITFALKLVDPIVDYNKYSPSKIPEESRSMSLVRSLYYEMGHLIQDRLLNFLAYRTARKLEKMGYKALPMPATQPGEELRLSGFFGIFSHRHAATRAGLGEFGFNNLVLTPEFGPRVRLSSVITEAEFEYDPLISNKICVREDCNICLKACPAIKLKVGVDTSKIFINTPSTTDVSVCRPTMFSGTPTHEPNATCIFYGTCMRVCPVKPQHINED